MSRRLPDVVVVVLDTARTFDVSAVWPDCPETTPALGRLAAESLVLTQATSPSCWTLPGHASLFTGLMPSRHGGHELSMRLPAGPPTMAELLAAAGYVTAAVSCNDLVGEATGLTRGYQRVVAERDPIPGGLDHALVARAMLAAGPVRRRLESRHLRRRFRSDHGGRRATALVERLLRELPPERPLHLFVNYLETHLPYLPPSEDASHFLPPGAPLEHARAVDQSALRHATGAVVHTARDWELLRSLYRGTMRYVDRLVDRLLGHLRAAGRFDGALLVVTSDHGENIGEHGLMDHQYSLNDTVLRVPLIVRLPGGAQAGVRSDLAMLTDVLPTVCEVVGIAPPATQGESLTAPVTRTHAVAEYLAPHTILAEIRRRHPQVDWSGFDRGLRSIRTATRKYIAASDGRNQFYCVDTDPMERENLFGRHPDEVELAAALHRWEAQERAEPTGPTAADATVTARLTALGYIE